MTDALFQLAKPIGNPVYHSERFLRYISSHLIYIKENGAVIQSLDRGLVHKFEYDFYSVLTELKVAVEDFAIYLIVNGFTSPTQMDQSFTHLIVPDEGTVAYLKQMFLYENQRV